MPVSVATIVKALADAGLLVVAGAGVPTSVAAISDDSRAVKPGGLFVAVRGSERDGHDFLGAAEKAGAAAALVEDAARTTLPTIVVRDGRRAAAVAAAAFYGEPASRLQLIGVTGTNGKTTTVGMLRHLLDGDGAPSASIGTLGVLIGSAGSEMPGGGGLTTPGPVELQRVLRQLVDSGVKSVAMEVSSHSLDQRRVDGLRFAVVVFTNLTRDHLDYHVSMESYFAAKASLIGLLAPDGTAVRNADDPAWASLPPAPKWLSFGEHSPLADMTASGVRFTSRGSAWQLSSFGERHDVRLPLIGDFNVVNALGAAAAAFAAGVPLARIAERLGTMPQVPGRLEILAEHPTVLRDYAHTPDALRRALEALRPFTPGALIVVFGAGGDRDRGKRPLMATAAAAHADTIIVTSDNPRTEDPERIIDDIVAPLPAGRFERIEDRRAAIARALALADPDRDVVLLAGKGHETYQVRGTQKLPFDERVIVQELLRLRENAGARS
jgi:UDP-N-acetylmuramoyl-L-alanyl-D-glutamate--2,6-diaminopimelate ligase